MLHPYFKREKGSYDVYVLWVTEKYGWGREPPAFRRAVAWGVFVIGKHRPDPYLSGKNSARVLARRPRNGCGGAAG